MKKTSIGHYALAYLLWLVTLGISLLVCMVVIEGSLAAMVAAEWHRYPVHAVRQFMIVSLGLIVLVMIVWNEHYYRTGAEKHRLIERFARIAGLSLVVMAIFHGVQTLLPLFSNSSIATTPLMLTVVEALIGVAGLWYAKRSSNERSLSRRQPA